MAATGGGGALGVCVLMMYCSGAAYLRRTHGSTRWHQAVMRRAQFFLQSEQARYCTPHTRPVHVTCKGQGPA